MIDTSETTNQKRVLVLTSAIVVLIVTGIVLFFVFGRVAEPLLSPATTVPVP